MENQEDQTLNPAQNTLNKVKKLAMKYSQSAFSYMYWPVEIEGLEDVPGLHITAKFFGDAPIDLEEIRAALANFETTDIDPKEIQWTPVVFDTKNDGKVPVLELTTRPNLMDHIHFAMDKFRRDDYPSYRAHITVPEEFWNRVSQGQLQPESVGLKILPLEIKIKGVTKFRWANGGEELEEIDGEDVTTNNPVGESLAVSAAKAIKSLKG